MKSKSTGSDTSIRPLDYCRYAKLPQAMASAPVFSLENQISTNEPELTTFRYHVENVKRPVGHKKTRKHADPAILGLAAFGLTTMVLQFHNFGWIGLGPVVSLGLIFGGLAQLVAGFQEFDTGNSFGYVAFSTYGAFWIGLALLLLGDHFGIYPSSRNDTAVFLLAFTFFTMIMLVGSFALNSALFLVFTLLLLGFICLDIAHFIPSPDVHQPPAAARAFTIMGGIVLLCCSLAAWYIMAALLFEETYGRPMLPEGPAPKDMIMQKLFRKTAKHRQDDDTNGVSLKEIA